MASPRLSPAVSALLVALALIAIPHASGAATPEVVGVSPTDTARTWTTPLMAGSNALDRTTCVENTTCDTVQIVVAPGNWLGKGISVSIEWLNPASDWDLYVFRDHLGGSEAGSSHGFIPQTREIVPITINTVLAAPRTYLVHVVGASATPEMVQGRVRVGAAVVPRTATRIYDPAFRFSANTTVLAPVATRGCEPSVRVDRLGNCYLGGIRGVPAGVDLWRFDLNPSSPGFDPEMRSPVYLGQPDAFAPNDTTGGRDGGGDIDIATSFPVGASETPLVTVVSLALANISSALSSDRGENFTLSPAVAAVPADDRQWIEAQGADTVYVLYRAPIPATGLFVQRSTDHGITYPVTSLVNATGSTPGYIDVDHASGAIYVSHHSDAAGLVSRSLDGGLTWQTTTVDNSTTHGNLFDPVKVGDDGTVYLTWSGNDGVYLAHSTDRAETWSAPVKVSGPESQLALMPWLEAGSAGRVAVVWYSSGSATNTNASDWRVRAAITMNATSNQPTFRIAEVSDHVIHASNLSLGGLTIPVAQPEPNRNLCDYFQVAIDPLGACVIAFTDDHNDYDGHTFVARQLSGPSLYASANGGTGQLEPITPTPLPTPDPALPEVSDFLHDAATGSGMQVIPNDSPFDILSIDYRCVPQGAAVLLEARMKLSDLSPVPANSLWRANFAANAPGPVADRGDQFFMRASTGADPTTPTYTFGSALRDTSGTLVYTDLGPCTSGAMDTTTNEVVMRLSISALDPYIAHGSAVRAGATLVGLRGATSTSGASAARDETRGGRSFVFCESLLDASPAASVEFGMSPPRPNPGRDGAAVNLALSHSAWVELAVFDALGRRVRTVLAGTLPAGTTRARWDGRTDSGHPAPSGVYFLRLNAGGQMRSQRLVMTK